MVGEASLSLATACFGTGMTGNTGHDADDVLYIAFSGDDAVPGKNGAKWNANSQTEFQNSIKAIGDRLIARIPAGGSPVPTTTAGGGGTPIPTSYPPTTDDDNCGWEGHCAGAWCGTDHNQCGDGLACYNSYCRLDPWNCLWPDHCLGASCGSHDECGEGLSCQSGQCNVDPWWCSWTGHCLGAACSNGDMCDDQYVCTNGVCSNP